MRERARVLKVEGSVVTLAPADPASCAGCSSAECGGKRGEFCAVNGRGLDLAPGMEVFVASSARKQGFQAALAVGVPAALGWLAWSLLKRFAPSSGDGLLALAALAAFLGGAALVYALSRPSARSLPEIVELA